MSISPNSKVLTRFLLTVLFFVMGIWFLGHEKAELTDVKTTLTQAHMLWVLAGIAITAVYLFLQGLMYVFSFATFGCSVGITDTIILFLKRNFISVFLPAGGVSSLAFFTGALENKHITKTQIHYASTLYAIVGIVSVIIVAIPAFIYALFKGQSNSGEWMALIILILICTLIIALAYSVYQRKWLYKKLVTLFPSIELLIEDVFQQHINRKKLMLTILVSIFIEFTGIIHVLIAMIALNQPPSIMAAIMAYIISVVFLIISPFLRGLGAVEVSMSIVLTRFGFSNIAAISITILYRFFEFWLPLFSGLFSFIYRINKFLMRIIPALMIMLLGIINIISAITPAISWRVAKLQEYIMIDAINASNLFVLVAGFFLLITAAFMLKGLRNAWWMAMILSAVSLIGHITKAIDYEEASVALFIIILLIATRKEYYVKSNPHIRELGIQTALVSVAITMIYGITGFYLLHQKHFNIDFSLFQSIRYTLLNYFLVGSKSLIPTDKFGHDFLMSINVGGAISMAFLIYSLIRPFVYKDKPTDDEKDRALHLLGKFGKSALDHFKVLNDKMLFCPADLEAFISYRVAGNFAVVLEDPVAANDSVHKECIRRFDRFCYENSLKVIYYRVPQTSLSNYKSLRKKYMFIGQEAVLDVNHFSLDGGNRKSIRNAINKIREKGYKINIHTPPVKDGILQKIKSVSDEWLDITGRSEIIFSQGSFEWNELKSQTIFTVENSEEKVIAFLNLIPDYAPDEGTYDLLRKTADAPNGIMDFILTELIRYLRDSGVKYLNLGFAPMAGSDKIKTFREKSIHFAYEKIRSFSHFRGLREYKDKFEPQWHNRYLIYDHDYDLINVPAALSRVIKKD